MLELQHSLVGGITTNGISVNMGGRAQVKLIKPSEIGVGGVVLRVDVRTKLVGGCT